MVLFIKCLHQLIASIIHIFAWNRRSWSICFLFLIFAFISTTYTQYADDRRGRQRRPSSLDQQGESSCSDESCHPPVGNLLIGRENKLNASSTCGLERPERYCIITHLKSRKKCYICNSASRYASDHYKYHGIDKVVSAPGENRFDFWWQAANGEENVYIQLDLEAEFHFTHLIMAFRTFRPAAMLIERSYDFGRTWKVYQYFAHNCAESFPGIPTNERRSIDDVVCVSEYSGLNPSRGGEVIFRVLPPHIRISDPYALEVQNTIKMTNLRINFTKLHTLGDDYLDSRPEIKEKYYYGIFYMTVRGSCSCYGHASECIAEPGQEAVDGMVYGRCRCNHFTQGANCEECMDLYNDLAWKPAIGKETHACKKCQCHEHASKCTFDPAVFEASGRQSGGVCQDCGHNTEGIHCESCKPGFYLDARRTIEDPYACQPCDCDPDGSLDEGLCDRLSDAEAGLESGKCHCKTNVDGRRCDRCKIGFWNFDASNPDGCVACACNSLGTIGNQGCNPYSGECICKRNVIGRDCNQCAPEFYGLGEEEEGCKACDCDAGGSLGGDCDAVSGQCRCRPNVEGRRCDRPSAGHFAPALDSMIFEAELAKGSSECRVVTRTPYAGQEPSWTGTGFMRVFHNSTLAFDVRDIPKSMDWDIMVRFEPQAGSQRWDDARILISRVGGFPDPESPCRTKLNFNEPRKVSLGSNDRVATVQGKPVCLDAGQRYEIKLEMADGRSLSGDTSSMLIDSIVLVPTLEEMDMFARSAGELRLREYNRNRCADALQSAGARNTRPPSSVCRQFWASAGLELFNGAQECKCDATGSNSADCDPLGGRCDCKPNVVGRRCDRCRVSHFGFGPDGCTACDCNSVGALDNNCEALGGQCKCRPGTYGRRCDECQPGFYGYPNCQRCDCNGHAETCDSRTGVCSDCRDNTDGARCDVCLNGFYGNPRLGSDIPCRPCPCPGVPGSGLYHAKGCTLDPRTNSPLCLCADGFSGKNCDTCAENHFGDPTVPGGGCAPCDCNDNIDLSALGNCDSRSGECQRCQYNTEGAHCERCTTGFYGNATAKTCRRCVCNPLGTDPDSGHCDHETGQCLCLPNVTGKACDTCELNHWDLASKKGCSACDCDPQGSYVLKCNDFDGQCHCKPGHGGRRCDECQPGFWGDPRAECFTCDCDPRGSASPQCDRNNGSCVCVEGIGGHKCDVCARGFMGTAPHCESCGECFKNWDVIVDGLKDHTKRLLDQARRIKQMGTTGAYKAEFDLIEERLKTVEDIIAGADVTEADIAEVEALINSLRDELARIQDKLNAYERGVESTVSRTTDGNLALAELRRQAAELERDTASLKENATELQEANVEGAYNLTREAQARSRAAEERVRTSAPTLFESERLRRETERMLGQSAGFYNQTYADNEASLDAISDRVRRLEDEIPDINELVCDGRATVDACDDLCGGAACSTCGGLSCDNGATTKAGNALELGEKTAVRLADLKKRARDQLEGSLDARERGDEALRMAQLAYERAMAAKNTSADTTAEMEDLLNAIQEFLDTERSKPAEIRVLAEECLKLDISLTPEEILALASQINETISSLTNIDRILVETAGDLATANDLKARADLAKEKADAILDKAKQVLEALKLALDAQQKAEKSIGDATKLIDEGDADLESINGETEAAGRLSAAAMDAIGELENRLDALKRKYTQNELDVVKAVEEAKAADELAGDGRQGAANLEDNYQRAFRELTDKARSSGEAKERAERLRERARTLAEAANTKLFLLRDMGDEFDENQNKLRNYKEIIDRLNADMGVHLERIEGKANFHRDCQSDRPRIFA